MATNFKAEIAEALFDSSVKVSREALLWAMTNLPDGENRGSHSAASSLSLLKDFNHEENDIFKAIGLKDNEVQELSKVMSKQLAKIAQEDSRVSIVVEGVIEAIDEHPNLLKLIVVKTVQDALEMAESGSEISKMMKIMKMIDKFKNRDNEED